jgi:hypothetical protein
MIRLWASARLVTIMLLAGCQVPVEPDQPVVFREHELRPAWDGRPMAALSARFDDPEEVLRQVFEQLPSEAIIYPTEGYYYFHANLEDREVMGNFRFLPAEASVSFAYFDVAEPMRYRSLTLPDDSPEFQVGPAGDDAVWIMRAGVRKTLRQSGRFLDARDQIDLLPNEVYVSGVFDESGVWFSLLFNQQTDYFYYLRNPDDPSAEAWTVAASVPQGRVLIGRRTGFVLVEDAATGRQLLAGVRFDDVRRNTYFDGPFDQVPPDLQIAEHLRAAYPYVEQGAGIDSHGSFLDRQGVRVAIAPYMTYTSRDEIVRTCLESLSSMEFVDLHQRVCYEPKRDAHKDPPPNTRRWPANHFRTVSYGWDAESTPSGREH